MEFKKKNAERDSISEAVSVLPEAAVELCTKGPQGRRVWRVRTPSPHRLHRSTFLVTNDLGRSELGTLLKYHDATNLIENRFFNFISFFVLFNSDIIL